VVVTVLGVREPSPQEWSAREAQKAAQAEPRGPRPPLLTLLNEYRGAAFFCLVVFAYWAGVHAVMPLISIYTKDVLGANDAEAQLLPALLLFSTTLFALPIVCLRSSYGNRRMSNVGYVE